MAEAEPRGAGGRGRPGDRTPGGDGAFLPRARLPGSEQPESGPGNVPCDPRSGLRAAGEAPGPGSQGRGARRASTRGPHRRFTSFASLRAIEKES